MIFSKLQSELVVSSHIFQFLSWNDLLRLRRVCKNAKILADDYLRLHGTLKRFIVLGYENVSDFLSVSPNLPISRFRLFNRDNSFLESEQMLTLVGLYGDKITHLIINLLEIPLHCCPKVVQFFDALPTLHHLEVKIQLQGYEPRISHGSSSSSSDDEEYSQRLSAYSTPPTPDLILPSTFKRLRHLHVRNYRCNSDFNSLQYLWTFLEECSAHLETILLPALPSIQRYINWAVVPGGEFGCVKRIVERRHEERPNDPLREIDLNRVSEDEEYASARSFYELVSTCSKYNVKLANVNANLIEGMMRLETPDKADHGRKISNVVTSFRFLRSSSFLLELPHLTKIRFDYEGNRNLGSCSLPSGRIERQGWPNLKEVAISVDSDTVVVGDSDNEIEVSTSILLDFFFKGIRRENMETLKMTFFNRNEDENCPTPIPKMRDVFSSCPNLKILEIGDWLGTNKAISKLWGNLPLLEKLTFENCENLGNSAFIGKDKANPAMLRMKSLRSLTLSGLKEMPKITDALFTSVLRRVSLKELHLKSCAYNFKSPSLTSITVAGISSLLVGEFAKSIEKLKLEISLQDVTEEELTDLGKLFRSSKMM